MMITKNISGHSIEIRQQLHEQFCYFRIQYFDGGVWDHIHKRIKIIKMALSVFCIACLYYSYKQGCVDVLPWTFIFVSAIVYVFVSRFAVYEENVIFIKDLGLQLSTNYLSGRTEKEFVPLTSIVNISINEVIHMQRIIYTLVVFIGNPGSGNRDPMKNNFTEITRAVTLFKGLKPRLDALVIILNKAHSILFSKERKHERKASVPEIIP